MSLLCFTHRLKAERGEGPGAAVGIKSWTLTLVNRDRMQKAEMSHLGWARAEMGHYENTFGVFAGVGQ